MLSTRSMQPYFYSSTEVARRFTSESSVERPTAVTFGLPDDRNGPLIISETKGIQTSVMKVT